MTTKEYIKSLTKDSEDAKKIATFKKPEEVYEFLKTKGVSDTYDEYINTAKDFAKQIEGLNEKDLEGAAGGTSPATPTLSTTLITTTATTATTVTLKD